MPRADRKPELIDPDSFPLGDGAGPALDSYELCDLERSQAAVDAKHHACWGNTPTRLLGPKVEFADRAPTMNGLIGIPAPHFSRARNANGLSWTVIPNLGRTVGAVLALPQGRPATSVADGMRLEYDVTVKKAGPALLTIHPAPTLDTLGRDGIRICVSLDEGPVQYSDRIAGSYRRRAKYTEQEALGAVRV